MGGRRFWGALAFIAVIAFAGRAVYVVAVTQHDITIDQAYYAMSANSLADGDGFRFAPLPGAATQENASHPPLPSAVLAAVAVVTDSDLVMRLAMAISGAGVVVLVGLIGRTIAGERAGLLAAGIAAVYPNLWVNDGLLLAETFATLCTAALVLLTYRLLRAPNWKYAAGAGLLCGLAMLTRGELALFLPLLVLPAALTIRDMSAARRLGLAVVALLAALVVLPPWAIYNHTRFERPVLLSTGDGGVLIGANCDGTYYGPRTGFWDGSCNTAVPGDASVLNEARREKAIEYMRDHLDRLPVVMTARVGRIWGAYQPFRMADLAEGDGRPKWVSLSGWAMLWPLAALALWGGLVMRRRNIRLLPLIAPFVVVTLVAAAFYGLLRFRTPAEVSLVVLGGVGADALLARVRRSRHADPVDETIVPRRLVTPNAEGEPVRSGMLVGFGRD
jgi:Dolichyl-phosphate-mannose-protein mannosyltransferase